jgi:hypothetical protein
MPEVPNPPYSASLGAAVTCAFLILPVIKVIKKSTLLIKMITYIYA